MTQRTILLTLKALIDAAPRHQWAREKALHVLATEAWSTKYVLHNLGAGRKRWIKENYSDDRGPTSETTR